MAHLDPYELNKDDLGTFIIHSTYMEKRLGKIESVAFGIGGYQDIQIGIHFTLGGKGWGVKTNKCTWDAELVEHTESCKWTEDERGKQNDEIVRFISKLLKQAKVESIDELKGKPIEATLEGNTLLEWRILEEVL